jgi:hypothetical protein
MERPQVEALRLRLISSKNGLKANLGPESKVRQEEFLEGMEHSLDYLVQLEESRAKLEAELQEVKNQVKSLQQDLISFSTFEQICNSGMLRNFKIDPESEFAQTILELLKQTMELQIGHLQATPGESGRRLKAI